MESDQREQFQISLNYEGNDVIVIVDDIEQAELLLNDNDVAQQLLKQFNINELQGPLYIPIVQNCLEHKTDDRNSRNLDEITFVQSSCSDQVTDTLLDVSDTDAGTSPVCKEQIWCRKKPTEVDLEATAELLILRLELASQFDDRKTVKAKLWQKVASYLQKHFNLGVNGAEKCRQKFSNLQRSYLAYIKHQKTTGSERCDDLPPFFDEIHSILGSKDKVNPAFLEDSMGEGNGGIENNNVTMETNDEASETESSITCTEDKEDPLPSTSKAQVDRFKTTRTKLKPLTTSESILKELQADRESQRGHFNFLKKHLKKTEDQRERFLDIIERAFGVAKKRKKDKFSSDSDEEVDTK